MVRHSAIAFGLRRDYLDLDPAERIARRIRAWLA